MASTLLSTILCLNLVASVSYLVFRALAFAGRKHISEKWRYNCITIIMCLYVIPFYKLLPGFPQAFTNVQPISVVGKNIVSGTHQLFYHLCRLICKAFYGHQMSHCNGF